LKKYQSNHFYFVEEVPGSGSEDIRKECNVNCFNFFFYSASLLEFMCGKITISLKNCTKIEKEKAHTHWKRTRIALSGERTVEF
jgi:hypothetical protein